MVKLSSTMIESVQARQRGAFQFEDHYDNLCALQDSVPLAAVKAHLGQGVIDLNGDRIRLNDWGPIINTVKINKSLQFVAVRSYYQVTNEEDEKRSAILRRKLPSIRSKEITHRLCKSLKECLFVSPTLSCIELQGLALRDRDLQVLVKGILRSQTLRHLSLESCRIGDQGLEILCKGLKNSKNINSVNLSGCSLSHRGADALAGVVKHQGMQRHNEAWRDSLRYRRPDLDRMAGLRRITINNNPMMGDEGARMLAEALKDDLWLKALDLQGCGISTTGTRSFLDVLKYNTTLVVLDLRRNPLVDRDVLHSLMEQLMLNSNGDDGEYKWMKSQDVEASPGLSSRGGKRRATKVLNSNVGKKTTIKIVPSGSRRKARSGVTTTPTRLARQDIQPSPGLPWRTAARANRFRGHPPDGTKYSTREGESPDVSMAASNSILISSATTNTNANNSRSHGNRADDDDDDDDDDTLNVMIEKENASMKMNRIAAEAAEKMRRLEENHLHMNLDNKKEVLIELEQMRRQLREERLTRARSDQKVVALMLENRRLSVEVESLKRGQRGVNGRGGGLAEDEKFLENIESSFKQFHAFIDMLKEAGLGQLVTMAGLDQNLMSLPPTTTTTTTTTTQPNHNNHDLQTPTKVTSRYHHQQQQNDYNNTTWGGAVSSSQQHHQQQQQHPHHHTTATSTSSQFPGNNNILPGSDSSHPQPHPTTPAHHSHNQQQQQRQQPSAYPISSMASFSEEVPIVIGGGGEGSRHGGTAHLEDTKDVARKEADEVYSRLLHDTHGSLSQPGDQPHSTNNMGGRTGGTFQSGVGVEEGEDDDDDDEDEDDDDDDDDEVEEEIEDVNENEWEEVSYENPASFNERGNESHQEKISRGDEEEDGSDNDDF